jgi:hypothetical protein
MLHPQTSHNWGNIIDDDMNNIINQRLMFEPITNNNLLTP